MRRVVAALCVAILTTPAFGQEAQMQIDSILHGMSRERIASRRSACAMGEAPKLAADAEAAGVKSPSAGAWCVAVLTRAGRDGTLGYVRDPRTDKPTPAIGFDIGFVSAYIHHQSPPADAPSMTALLPVADRCLNQQEQKEGLCAAVGQIMGSRAAHGEDIKIG